MSLCPILTQQADFYSLYPFSFHRRTLPYYLPKPTGDVKTRNALLKNGEQLLCDLDAAGPVGSVKGTDEKMGSSAYFSPSKAQFFVCMQALKQRVASARAMVR